MDILPNLRISALLAVLAAPLLVTSAQTPHPDASTRAPRFSLSISLPQDDIHGDAEVPLDITMTNTSGAALACGDRFGPPLWTYLCHLDVRDSEGKLLEQKSSVRQFRDWTRSSGPRDLQPGEKVQVEVLLN